MLNSNATTVLGAQFIKRCGSAQGRIPFGCEIHGTPKRNTQYSDPILGQKPLKLG